MDPAELIAAAALLARCEAAPVTYIEERDKHQHRHVDDGSTRPPTFTPPEPLFISNRSNMLDTADQVATTRAALMRGHPAYLGASARPLFYA